MARKPPPESVRFKKGKSGNPLGGKLHDPVIKAFKKLTKEQLMEVGSLVVQGDTAALKAIAANPNATVLQTMLAAVAVRIINKGDMAALDVLLNRLIGKVKDDVHIVSNVENPPQIIVTLPDNGRSVRENDTTIR